MATMPNVSTYPFLSDEWFEAVAAIVSARKVEIPAHAEISMNVVVTDTPFGEDRQFHVAALAGEPDWGMGHLNQPDLTLTTDYTTAREIFISANPQAGMQAYPMLLPRWRWAPSALREPAGRLGR